MAAWALPAVLAVTGCGGPPTPVNDDILKGTRYIRYTLRTEPWGYQQAAYRSNYLSWPPFANAKVGSKVQFLEYTKEYVDLSLGGIRCRMFYADMPFPTDPEGLRGFVEKHFAATEQEVNLNALDKDIRRQVENGIAAIPMTKEQVFMALGYPAHIDNHAVADALTREQVFASNTWMYRSHQIMMFPIWWVYQFNDEGKLANVVK
jgi:hypothetical protein